jgi:hypothetical protein
LVLPYLLQPVIPIVMILARTRLCVLFQRGLVISTSNRQEHFYRIDAFFVVDATIDESEGFKTVGCPPSGSRSCGEVVVLHLRPEWEAESSGLKIQGSCQHDHPVECAHSSTAMLCPRWVTGKRRRTGATGARRDRFVWYPRGTRGRGGHWDGM